MIRVIALNWNKYEEAVWQLTKKEKIVDGDVDFDDYKVKNNKTWDWHSWVENERK